MMKKFCCCFSLKAAVTVTIIGNILLGIAELIAGTTELISPTKTDENLTTVYIVCVITGFLAVVAGIVLFIGLFMDKEKYVLLFLLLGLIHLKISSVYFVMNLYKYHLLILAFLYCVFLWYCLYSTYSYYILLRQYNTTNSGAIEISYSAGERFTNTNKGYEPDIDSTAV